MSRLAITPLPVALLPLPLSILLVLPQLGTQSISPGLLESPTFATFLWSALYPDSQTPISKSQLNTLPGLPRAYRIEFKFLSLWVPSKQWNSKSHLTELGESE